jgi:hypothetical protein
VIESDTDTDDDVIESDTNIDDDVIETFAQGDCAECPHCKQWNQCTTPDGGDGMICSECDAIIWANPEQPTELDEERIRDIELEEHPIIRLMTKHATKWTEEEELQLEVLVQRWIREEGVNPTKLAPSAIASGVRCWKWERLVAGMEYSHPTNREWGWKSGQFFDSATRCD